VRVVAGGVLSASAIVRQALLQCGGWLVVTLNRSAQSAFALRYQFLPPALMSHSTFHNT